MMLSRTSVALMALTTLLSPGTMPSAIVSDALGQVMASEQACDLAYN